MLLPLLGCTAARADLATDVRGLLDRAEPVAALARLEAATPAERAQPRLAFMRGVALMDLRRDSEALSVFTQLTESHPQLPDPYNNIAAIHARAARWNDARIALETALRNDASHALARENLGDVHLQLALEHWGIAERAAGGPALERKLRLGRELAGAPAAAR